MVSTFDEDVDAFKVLCCDPTACLHDLGTEACLLFGLGRVCIAGQNDDVRNLTRVGVRLKEGFNDGGA